MTLLAIDPSSTLTGYAVIAEAINAIPEPAAWPREMPPKVAKGKKSKAKPKARR